MKLADPRWRLNNLYKIVDKNGRLITFRENKHQRLVNEDPSREKVILKARQIGFSTSCILRLFDKTIWNKNQTSVILAHEQDSIQKLFRIVYRAYKFMHPSLQPVLDRGGGSKYQYFFPEINSRIYCDLESRSDTIQNLHVSEFGLMKNDDRVRATVDAVPISTGEITFESTPKGMNHFHEKWVSGSGRKFFFPWYTFDEYKIPVEGALTYTDEEIEFISLALRMYNVHISPEQIAFRRWKIMQKGGGQRGLSAFKEEFPEDDISCFLASGESVMDLFVVTNLINQAKDPISDKEGLTIHFEPDKFESYVIGADVAEGVKKDYSVGVVIGVRSRKVAAVLRGWWKPSEFAHRLADLGRMYRAPGRSPALLSVERNNHGHAVLLELNEHIGYENLYVHTDEKLGWRTDLVTRPIMISAFIDSVEKTSIEVHDKNILGECLTLVDANGKIEACEGKHDDCVMATAIAIQALIKESGSLEIIENVEGNFLL